MRKGPLTLVWLALAATLALGAACGRAEEKPAAAPAAGPATGAINVAQGDNFFVFRGQRQPKITAKSGEEITVNLSNKGKAIHSMRVAGLDGRYETADDFVSSPDALKAGAKGSLKFKLDRPGTYNFRCDFHPDEMTGTIAVQ